MATISVKVDSTEPSWLAPLDFNWVVGEVVDENLNEDNIDHTGNIKTNVIYEVVDATAPLAQLGLTLERTGHLHGTILEFQGGTYALTYKATNARGSTESQVNAAVISLIVGPPVWAIAPDDVQDIVAQEVGSLFSPISMVDYITGDGSQAENLSILYEDDDGALATIGLSIHAFSGQITGTFLDNVGVHVITVKATNSKGFSSTESFNITVIAVDGASEIPVFGGWFAGLADINGCTYTGVVPTWKAGGAEFFREMNDADPISIDMLLSYIASDGGSPITAVTVSVGALPSGLDPINTNGLGFISGVYDLGVADTGIDIQLTATNSAGVSLDSPVFTFIYFNGTATPVDISGISAVDGSNDVRVQLTEAVYTTLGTAASYEEGFSFEVNLAPRGRVYKSDGGTSSLVFTLDGAAFSGENQIDMDFVA